MNELDKIAVPLLQAISKEAKGVWKDPTALYYPYRGIQIDKRGSFGERFFEHALLMAFPRRIKLEYKDGDQGEWDLKVNGYKFEIKTSSLDVNGYFQNEGLQIEGDYYGVLFLCVTPNKLYFKFVKKEDIPFNTLHDRKRAGTGSGYKWDHRLETVYELNTIEDFRNKFNEVFPEVFKTRK